ncbi:MAG TPA: nucleotide exchange factor GrpE, partial [Deltaproteobacteria bacterium]|nr:nucleotide exchange factor GrpE [Deltaproteobacteria bacterium]
MTDEVIDNEAANAAEETAEDSSPATEEATAATEDHAAPPESEPEEVEASPEEDDSEGPRIEIIEEDPAQQEIDRLEGVVAELQGRLRAVSAAYQKQQSEVAATRDRLKRQAAVQEELRRGEVVSGLFEPVENLRRSLDAAKKGASNDDTVQGLELVLKAFMDSFGKLGLEEVPGKGAAFDPNIHEALTTIPVTDAALDQAVIEVFAAGYRIGSRLIRPAKVIVGAYQEP